MQFSMEFLTLLMDRLDVSLIPLVESHSMLHQETELESHLSNLVKKKKAVIPPMCPLTSAICAYFISNTFKMSKTDNLHANYFIFLTVLMDNEATD